MDMLMLILLLQLALAILTLGDVGIAIAVVSFFLVMGLYLWIRTHEEKGRYLSLMREEMEWLYDGIAEMAGKAGIGMPRVYILDDYIPNAYSFKNTIVLSLGLFEVLDREEILAVAAHEIGHLKNGDTRLFPLIAYSRYLMMAFTFLLIALSKNALVMMAAGVIYLLYEMSRADFLKKREFKADETALHILDTPLSLKYALEELKYYEDLRMGVRQNALPSIEPGIERKQKIQAIDTHPSYDERILRIIVEVNSALRNNRVK